MTQFGSGFGHSSTPPAPPAQEEQQQEEQQQEETAGESPRKRYADWPQKGDERAQPWDLDAVGISKEDRELEPGARDTVSPVVIRHSAPILASGDAHPIVGDLGRRLAELGYENSVSKGENAFGTVDDTIMAAVDRFRTDYGVEEDPTPYGAPSTATKLRAALIIGPYTWEAIFRASDRQREDEDDS